jgi:HEXXH motif-containing protein
MMSLGSPLIHLRESDESPVAFSGLCWPEKPDSEIDELAVKSILARRDRMAEAFAGIRFHQGLDNFIRGLCSLPAMDALRLFDNAWSAAVFRWPPRHVIDDAPFEPDFTDRIRWALACAAEQPGASAAIVVPPPLDQKLAYLYFPNRHVLLNVGEGPVAIAREERLIRLTNADGRCFTLPQGSGSIPAGKYAASALWALEHAAGWPLLNGIPLFMKFSPGPPVPPEEARKTRVVITEALELLQAVWPAAKAFAERWVRGVLVLPYSGCSRSHTSVHAPQVLMCSTESASKVAEALCHELSHARMFLVLERDPILKNDFNRTHHSAWRRDARPLLGLLNGVHAFLNVCRYYQRLQKKDPARWGKECDFVLKTQIPKISVTWSYIQQHAVWTGTGERVASDLDAAVREICR